MKLMLLGSSPSAIHATLTPAPVSPSDRAVGWLGSSESVLVEVSPSGSSCGAPALQAPGITLGETVGPAKSACSRCAREPFATLAAAGVSAGAAPWIVTSGITL